ncbi:MAG: hypothetical protein OEM00_10325 [Burkholderiaceae bacterium]|nr:hypothetical protein [Burkholderiaceae bacterium]
MPCLHRNPQKRYTYALVVVIAASAATALAQRSPVVYPKPLPADITPRIQLFQCGDFTGHFGPLDYRTADPRDRKVVQEFHLDMEIQTFMLGRVEGRNRAGTGGVAGGFQYTLKAFPNHPVALKAMEELGRKLNSEQPQRTSYPLECWYIRAFMITPDDPIVRAMYGIYLSYRERAEEAQHNLDIADQGLQYSRTMQYLMGEARFRLQQYDRAQLNAMRATSLGFPGDSLQKRLQEGGHWNPQLQLPADVSEARPGEPPTSAASAGDK